mgnify:CR=1 FL=1
MPDAFREAQNIIGVHTAIDHRSDISILRLMATLGVIMVHTCNTITNNINSFADITKWQLKSLILVNGFVNWCVPVFFMITGCLLLRKDSVVTYEKNIGRYVRRVLLALLIFGTVFSWMEIITETKTISLHMFPEGLLRTIEGNSWGHLWYLYELVGIYLIFPIIKIFSDNASKKEYKTVLCIVFLFNLCFATVNDIYPLIGFYLPVRGNSLFYMLLGRYLDVEKEEYPKDRVLYVLIFCLAILLILGAVDSEIISILTGYCSPLIGIMSAAIFLCVSRIKIKQSNILWKLDRLCFGVYLVHPVFTNLFYKFFNITPLLFERLIPLGIFLFFLMFAVLSFIASYIMNKIPILKRYVL